MIQPVRRYHRLSVRILCGFLPVVFVGGLLARRPIVSPERSSDRINLTLATGTDMVLDARELWDSAVDGPDMLLYWAENKPAGESLPARARLLGTLYRSRRDSLRVPGGQRDRGYLVLYSPAYGKVTATAPVPKEMP